MADQKISQLPTGVVVKGTVFAAVNTGNNEQLNIPVYESVTVINDVDDFPTPVSGLITLDTSQIYHIDGEVDIGANSLVIPTTGACISGVSGGRDGSKIVTSEPNHTMFVSPSGFHSGNLEMSTLTITADGVGSQVFDMTNLENGNALDIINVNFLNCTSLGELTSYRQVLLSDVGFINVSDGLMFSGTWSGGLAVLSTIAINFPAATLFKEGTALLFNGSVRSDMNFNSVNTASVFMDFQPSNVTVDSGLTLTNFRTTAADALPNFPASSVKCRYSRCVGIDNTYVGGGYTISTAVTTTISSSNTLTKMAGITTYADLEWFLNTDNNELTYTSNQSVDVQIIGSLSFVGGGNDKIGLQIRKFDASLSSYVEVGARFSSTLNAGGGGTRIENLAFFGTTNLNQNDRIEIWIENQSDTTNITAELGGSVGVSERSS